MSASIEVSNAAALRKALRNAADRSVKEVSAGNRAAAEVVAKYAVKNASRFQGQQGSGRHVPIKLTIRAGATAQKGYVKAGGAFTRNAAVTEYGGTLRRHASAVRTDRRHPTPYLHPALDQGQTEAVNIYAAKIEAVIQEFNK